MTRLNGPMEAVVLDLVGLILSVPIRFPRSHLPDESKDDGTRVILVH